MNPVGWRHEQHVLKAKQKNAGQIICFTVGGPALSLCICTTINRCNLTGRHLLSHLAAGGAGDHAEVHEQAGAHPGQARRADAGGHQAVLRQRGEGGVEAGHAQRPVRDRGHHAVRHLCQHPPQGTYSAAASCQWVQCLPCQTESSFHHHVSCPAPCWGACGGRRWS